MLWVSLSSESASGNHRAPRKLMCFCFEELLYQNRCSAGRSRRLKVVNIIPSDINEGAAPCGTLSDTSTCPTLFRAAATSACDCANSSESPPSRPVVNLLPFSIRTALCWEKVHGSGPGTFSWLQTKFSLSVIFVTVYL